METPEKLRLLVVQEGREGRNEEKRGLIHGPVNGLTMAVQAPRRSLTHSPNDLECCAELGDEAAETAYALHPVAYHTRTKCLQAGSKDAGYIKRVSPRRAKARKQAYTRTESESEAD